MSRWNKERRLLDHEHTSFWHHKLQEVEEPNLMRNIFPYTEVARIDFDYKFVAPQPPEQMLLTDTTFRDGQQARPPYTVAQIVAIFDLLHRLSGPQGIVRQTEFFLYSAKDKEAVQQCRERGYEFPEITGWIRAHASDLALVKEMGLTETGILTSVSDYHIFLKLKWDRKKAMEDYLAIVKAALAMGIKPRCHMEDVTRADIYGFCVPFAIELMKLREESGIDIKLRLCDTMGYGVPYCGAALPRSVPRLVRAMIEDAGVPGHLLEWHGHNDFHKVLVNSVTAWLYGCGAVNGALLGFGERTGNAPIEGMLMEYISLRGTTDGIDTIAISEIGEYFERELHYHIPANYPFVGKNFNNTSAGIHADGLLKNEEIYNAFDTGKILNRPVRITITDKSGKAGIVHWLNNQLKLEGDRAVDKNHPGVAKIFKRSWKCTSPAAAPPSPTKRWRSWPAATSPSFLSRSSTSSKARPTTWRPIWRPIWRWRKRSGPWTRPAWSPSSRSPWITSPSSSSCTSSTWTGAKSPGTSPTSWTGPSTPK